MVTKSSKLLSHGLITRDYRGCKMKSASEIQSD